MPAARLIVRHRRREKTRWGIRWPVVLGGYERLATALLGIGLTLPLFLSPGQASGPRLGDLAMVVALALPILHWRRMGRAGRGFVAGAGLLMTVTVLIQAIRLGEAVTASDLVFWFRWFVAGAVAPALGAMIVADAARRRLFFAAVLAGAAAHLATYGLLTLFGRDTLQAVGLASPRAAYTSVVAHVRITTVAEHPNAAMAMIGLAVPACLALVGGRIGTRPLALTGAATASAGFLFTLSRGGVVAAVCAGLARMVVARRRGERIRPLGLVLGVALLAAGLLAMQVTRVDLDVGRMAARFDVERLDDNIEGRAETWRRTADFVARHPLGVGWASADELGPYRALTVSHNGYLFVARTLGAIVALLLLGLHLLSAGRLDAFTPLAVYLLAMMMSEDVAQGAGFVLLNMLVAATAFRRPVAP